MILFGVRSPIVVEYEETCHRRDMTISMAVNVNGVPRLLSRKALIELADLPKEGSSDHFIACAFVPQRREELTEMAQAAGLVLAKALIDPTAIIARSVRFGDGTFVNAGVVIGAASIIGAGVLVNRASSLGHHTVLQDYVSIGPGVTLAGNIQVGRGSIIGAGSVVLPNLRIGAGAIVAAGSLVRTDVPDGTFVAGSPATQRRFDPKRSTLHVEDGE